MLCCCYSFQYYSDATTNVSNEQCLLIKRLTKCNGYNLWNKNKFCWSLILGIGHPSKSLFQVVTLICAPVKQIFKKEWLSLKTLMVLLWPLERTQKDFRLTFRLFWSSHASLRSFSSSFLLLPVSMFARGPTRSKELLMKMPGPLLLTGD
jgi:hypothetical protein